VPLCALALLTEHANKNKMFEDHYNGLYVDGSNFGVEYEYFTNFINDHPTLKPFRSEWTVYDEELRLSGSIDMLFINEDGTVNNILNLVGPQAIESNEDLKDLLHFDYTDWAYDDKPGPQWTYDRETEVWTKPTPFVTNVVVENIIPIVEPVEAEPIGGQE
jgi:hypothetical protein